MAGALSPGHFFLLQNVRTSLRPHSMTEVWWGWFVMLAGFAKVTGKFVRSENGGDYDSANFPAGF